jgi:hypothetical protein
MMTEDNIIGYWEKMTKPQKPQTTITRRVIHAIKERHAFTVTFTASEVQDLLKAELIKRLKDSNLPTEKLETATDIRVYAIPPRVDAYSYLIHEPSISVSWDEQQ